LANWYQIVIDGAYNLFDMLTILLILAGLICFWLFFKSIDWFEKI